MHFVLCVNSFLSKNGKDSSKKQVYRSGGTTDCAFCFVRLSARGSDDPLSSFKHTFYHFHEFF